MKGASAAESGSSRNDTCRGRPTPLGCAAAEEYLRWYPHLGKFLAVEAAYAYHVVQGKGLGFAWPRSDPCSQTRSPAPTHLLTQMLVTWQQMARARGLPHGLHILLTMNHQAHSAPEFSRHLLAGRDKEGSGVRGMVQFLPTSLVSLPFMTKGWPWAANGNFYWGVHLKCYHEEMKMPASVNLTAVMPPRGWKVSCECLHRHVASDELEHRFKNALRLASRKNASQLLSYVRGAFASWSNYPRIKHRGAAYCRGPSPAAFENLVRVQLSRALADAGGAVKCAATGQNVTASAAAAWRHLILINSWNEWGEQAAIEPSVEDDEALLDAHLKAVQNVTERVLAVGRRRR